MRRTGKLDYLEMPATGGTLDTVKAFYAAAFGWSFTDYGPAGGNFAGVYTGCHGVHLLAGFLQLRGNVVSGLNPGFHGLCAKGGGPVFFDDFVHSLAYRGGNGTGTVRQKQHKCLARLGNGVKQSGNLGRVVETDNGGAIALHHDFTDGVKTVLHGVDLIGAHPALLWLIFENFYGYLGDKAQSALAAKEKVTQVGAC